MANRFKYLLLLSIFFFLSFPKVYAQIRVTECAIEDLDIYAINSIEFTTDGIGWAVGQRGAIYKYEKNEWTKQQSPTENNLNKIYFKNDKNAWIIGDYGTILKYSKGVWEETDSPVNTQNNFYGIDFNDKGVGYIVGSNGIIMRFETNRWQTWKTLELDPQEGIYTIKFSASNHAVIGGSNSLYEIKNGVLNKIDNANIIGLGSDTKLNLHFNTIEITEEDVGYIIGPDLIEFYKSRFEIIGKLPSTRSFGSTVIDKELWSVSSYHIYQISNKNVQTIKPNIRTTFRDIAFSDPFTAWVVGTKNNLHGVICKCKRDPIKEDKR